MLSTLTKSEQFENYLTAQPTWVQSLYTTDDFVRGMLIKEFERSAPASHFIHTLAYEQQLKIKALCSALAIAHRKLRLHPIQQELIFPPSSEEQ